MFLYLCLESSGTKRHLCDSPQYVELGESRIINCHIEESILVLSWYNSTDYVNDYPLIYVSENVKGGSGFLSQEYDIFPNGSLIIRTVSLKHDHVFTISVLLETLTEPIVNMVDVIVTVKPKMMFPFIHNCGDQKRICFEAGNDTQLMCSVTESRPLIPLLWMQRTVHSNITLHYESITTQKDASFSSKVTTNPGTILESNFILLVCKADSPPRMLNNDESLVLVQNHDVNFSNVDTISRNAERNSDLFLVCTEYETAYIVWKRKRPPDNGFHELGYAVYAGEEHTEVFHEGYALMKNGTLVIPEIEIEHEAFYGCVFGDGINEGSTLYHVNVYVYAYPIVKGCQQQQDCVLEVTNQGTLTCTINRVRPSVSLSWNIVYENEAALISFRDTELSYTDHGDTFDVKLSSFYVIEADSPKQLTIECKVPEFEISKKVHLHFKKGSKGENSSMTSRFEFLFERKILVIIPIAGMLALLMCIFCGVYCPRTHKRRQTASNLEPSETVDNEETKSMLYIKMENTSSKGVDDTCSELEEETNLIQGTETLSTRDSEPFHPYGMQPTVSYETEARKGGDIADTLRKVEVESNSNEGKRKQFIAEIKTIYSENYNAVQPIPYKKEMFCVDQVFVDGGIEFLDSTGEWQPLDSYRDVFNSPSLKSKRRFIEGDPAYGKSILALQLAYDWCNPSKASCLRSVEIFILLRLRQFKGVKSIYEAITRFLLPRDSQLDKNDVKDVLLNSKSVVIVLDGYDEYPDGKSDTDSDIAKIILRQMFQNYEMILTTRSSHLPLKYSHVTKRIRLTGFNKKARKNYIERVISKKKTKDINEIEKYLKENPILSNICQTPLFCALFVHVAQDTSDIRSINTVTTVFKYAIRCFHSHMKNKMTDENVPITHATDRTKFYEVAFKSLTREKSKISWTKKELCNEIGSDLYSEYIKIGILVEEEVVPSFDGPDIFISDYNQPSVEVTFYHKLFCEWYAAHHVTENCNPASLNDLLVQLDPFDVQYVFRFSCGLNTYCANQIINYLKKVEGGSKFAILCFLEIPDTKEDMKETIRALCNEGLVIAGSDSLLLQQSTLQLLEIAPQIKARIGLVGLYGSFKSTDMSRNVIILESNLEISHELPFEDLTISFTNKTPTDEDWENIIIFCSKCPQLKELWLLDCVPPYTITLGPSVSGFQLSNLGVNVKWRTKESDVFILDLDKGQWKLHLKGEPEFLKIQQFNKLIHTKKRKQTIEDNKRQVENIRETLRTATHIDTSDRRMEAIRDFE